MPVRTDSAPDPVLQAIGEAIRALRLERGISQERLALVADVDRSYVGRIDRAENNIAVPTLVRIASALSIWVSELMARAGV